MRTSFLGYSAAGLLFSLSLISQVQAQTAADLELSVGQAASSHSDISMHFVDVRSSVTWLEITTPSCQMGPGLRAGHMSILGDDAWRVGGEWLTRCEVTPWLQVGLPLGLVRLSDHYFLSDDGERYKNVGGPWQFVVGVMLSVRVNAHWSLGVEVSHMSNWNNYDPNPGLNSHHLFVRYAF